TGIITNPSTQTSLSIGRCGAYAGQYFNGTIDEVRVYNRSLSVAEIFDIYTSGGMIGNYHPADTSNNLAIDANEFTAYNRNWRLQLPDLANAPTLDYYSRANYLFKMGEIYHFDSLNAACNVPVPGATCWLSG
ncbi:MAG: LamG-like jellyroll fold domain-containing protein, partial [Nanoarchaeota archaeon]